MTLIGIDFGLFPFLRAWTCGSTFKEKLPLSLTSSENNVNASINTSKWFRENYHSMEYISHSRIPIAGACGNLKSTDAAAAVNSGEWIF